MTADIKGFLLGMNFDMPVGTWNRSTQASLLALLRLMAQIFQPECDILAMILTILRFGLRQAPCFTAHHDTRQRLRTSLHVRMP